MDEFPYIFCVYCEENSNDNDLCVSCKKTNNECISFVHLSQTEILQESNVCIILLQ